MFLLSFSPPSPFLYRYYLFLLFLCISIIYFYLFLLFFFNFLMFIYFERKRERVIHEWGTEREGDTESEAGLTLWAVSTEPDMGLEPTSHRVITWAEVGCSIDWATQVPLLLNFLEVNCIGCAPLLLPTLVYDFLKTLHLLT